MFFFPPPKCEHSCKRYRRLITLAQYEDDITQLLQQQAYRHIGFACSTNGSITGAINNRDSASAPRRWHRDTCKHLSSRELQRDCYHRTAGGSETGYVYLAKAL